MLTTVPIVPPCLSVLLPSVATPAAAVVIKIVHVHVLPIATR